MHPKRRAVALSVILLAGVPLGGASGHPPYATIVARAFVVTDQEVVAPFTFERTVERLAPGSAGSWERALVPVRDERVVRRPVLDGFPAPVRIEPQGAARQTLIGRWSAARPIAIVNRFDLAPAGYATCGESRLIFSRRTERGPKYHVAVEVAVPNPRPAAGAAGCREVAAFWWDLAKIDDPAVRRERLERLFFSGFGPLPPLFEPAAFERHGRIRTIEISNGPPVFRQFAMRRSWAAAKRGAATLVRVPLDNTPAARFFDATPPSAAVASFRREFLRQIPSLALPDVARYSMNIDPAYCVSDAGATIPDFNYRLPFRRLLRTADGGQFRDAMLAELAKIGSTLTPEEVIDRAETQNCGGCHGKHGPVGEGVVFPQAFENGEQIADDSLPGPLRFSPALQDVFLPYRVQLLYDYLHQSGERR